MNEFWNTVGTGAAGSLLGGITQQLNYGLGELTGYNDALRKEQLKQQQALTTMQFNSNLNLMKAGYAEQLKMWEATNYPAQIEQLKQAGLNPALMYAKGSSGGTTGSGSASVGSGQASDVAARQASQASMAMNGMAMMKLQSEIDLNKANAELLRAQKPKVESDTHLNVAQLEKVKEEILNISADTSLKDEQVKLNQLQQQSTEIANTFNREQNLNLLNQTIQTIRELTARANVAEQTQSSLVELAKQNVQMTISNILLNDNHISLNSMEMSLIRNKIIEIANTISVSNKQLVINENQLKQALEMKQMELSGGMIVNQIRGVATAIRNSIYNTSDYKW